MQEGKVMLCNTMQCK